MIYFSKMVLLYNVMLSGNDNCVCEEDWGEAGRVLVMIALLGQTAC